MKFTLFTILGLALSVAAAPVASDSAEIQTRAGGKCATGISGLGCILGGIGKGNGNGNVSPQVP